MMEPGQFSLQARSRRSEFDPTRTLDDEPTDRALRPVYLRVCPKTSSRITKFSQHEAD